MKKIITILGIMLIAGFLLAGPVSATSIIGKGTRGVNYGYGDYNYYKWTTYKYTNYNVKMVLTRDVYYSYVKDGTDKYVIDIVRAGTNRVKVVQSVRYYNSKTTYKYWDYYYVKGGNAVKFYNTETFKRGYLKVYLY